ncbi:PREDICTED: protein FAR1-RELATED SEQUENCE 5-like isoform X2 [Nelumbo nucifera]|uniref:Protein FAR1-RELATED SEQUENCE 5-like isoform X2 n=1 Tax=Nelumbo nucifera TaxID=4432 RepID=A0A1U7Z159_NELNU|nr:PREDICTED: protein FAR1-RELATED SEQUENCE 5-like isoform X2 [Nelumbo nucifera]
MEESTLGEPTGMDRGKWVRVNLNDELNTEILEGASEGSLSQSIQVNETLKAISPSFIFNFQKPLYELTDAEIWKMQFDSVNDATKFYYDYAREIGFKVRKSDKEIYKGCHVSQKFVCSAQGEQSIRENRRRAPKRLTRFNCTASFQLHGRITNGDEAQVADLRDTGGLQNHIDADRRDSISTVDVDSALLYFESKTLKDPGYFYSHTIDEHGRLQNLLWTDSKACFDYHCFGDVLIFDSTYRSNVYRKPLIIFFGINNHHQTVIFAAALLEDETKDSYMWMLNTFLRAMNGRKPISVVTDCDKALRKAIKNHFPDAQHRLCSFHISENVVSHCANIIGDFNNCMNMEGTPEQFEEAWNKMINARNLGDQQWLSDLYRKRDRWAETYLHGHFFAGVRTTQRCESENAYVKCYLTSRNNLTEFFRHFEIAVMNNRQREAEVDFQSKMKKPVIGERLKLYKEQMGSVYTKASFEKFCMIADEETNFVVDSTEHINDHQRIHFVCKWDIPESRWRVLFDSSSIEAKCSCLKFEELGFPCVHMIAVFKVEHLRLIPESCIVKRWTLNAKANIHQGGIDASIPVSKILSIGRFIKLLNMSYTVCYLGAKSYNTFNETMVGLNALKMFLEGVDIDRGTGCQNLLGGHPSTRNTNK